MLAVLLLGPPAWPVPALEAAASVRADVVRADPVRITDPLLAHLVRRSMRGAAKRLARGDCRLLLSEFTDEAGRTLEETARERGLEGSHPSAYLEDLLYYDGASTPACARSDVFAITARPGSRVVRVCGRRFQGVAERNPTLAEASLIHEMLHSLGLGESPPDSRTITERVLQRCR
jgi:hypothetical protein